MHRRQPHDLGRHAWVLARRVGWVSDRICPVQVGGGVPRDGQCDDWLNWSDVRARLHGPLVQRVRAWLWP